MGILLAELNDAELDAFFDDFMQIDVSSYTTESVPASNIKRDYRSDLDIRNENLVLSS
jgi:hypothetical protein